MEDPGRIFLTPRASHLVIRFHPQRVGVYCVTTLEISVPLIDIYVTHLVAMPRNPYYDYDNPNDGSGPS